MNPTFFLSARILLSISWTGFPEFEPSVESEGGVITVTFAETANSFIWDINCLTDSDPLSKSSTCSASSFSISPDSACSEFLSFSRAACRINQHKQAICMRSIGTFDSQ